ncbi:MAG: pyridoxamine 5'-phosphate oxidase family protein [Candidatus Cloacimonadaceae bacterium]|nr:pyridoxamine 5'-phosphate oxidase family protein [Candidatus Cloacimonadaceae bacterium]
MAKTNESALQAEIQSWIKRFQYSYLATIDKNRARVRPVVLFWVDDRYSIITFSGDAKVQQIAANKNIEICIPIREDESTGYIRFLGTAKISTNMAEKSEAAEYCYFFDEYFRGVDDPDFTLIFFDPSEAEFLRPGETYCQSCILKRY